MLLPTTFAGAYFFSFAFISWLGHPQLPPQPGFLRFFHAPRSSNAKVMTTTKSASGVCQSVVMIGA